jgi:hypothetical protein
MNGKYTKVYPGDIFLLMNRKYEKVYYIDIFIHIP